MSGVCGFGWSECGAVLVVVVVEVDDGGVVDCVVDENRRTTRRRRRTAAAAASAAAATEAAASHRILSCPLASQLVVLFPVGFVYSGDFRHQRIVRIRVAQQRADG